MKKIIYTFFVLLFVSCKKDITQNNIDISANVPTIITPTVATSAQCNILQNVDISTLAKVLLHTKWNNIIEVGNLNTLNDYRNRLISILQTKCNNSIQNLQSLSNADLAWGSLMYKFLLDAGIRNVTQLLSMSLNDYRNTIIVNNQSRTGFSLQQLQSFDNKRNLNEAHKWWFDSNPNTKNIISKLNTPTGSMLFNRKNTNSENMDVLKIVKADEPNFKYLALYHRNEGTYSNGKIIYNLYLAGSEDLISWTRLTRIASNAHQGDIKKWGNGYIIAFEQDINGSDNKVVVKHFSSFYNMYILNTNATKTIDRSFSCFAEGTPDIKTIVGTSPRNSSIEIGFHYFDNGFTDKVAFGILTNFNTWKPFTDEISNYNIQQLGFMGNIGGRKSFNYQGDYVLQEAQIVKDRFETWRLLFGNGAFYSQLNIKTPANLLTPGSSVSFANPGITQIGTNSFVVTSFMFTEGNVQQERGQLLYTTNF